VPVGTVVVEFLAMVLVKTSVCDRIGGSTVVTLNEGRGAEMTLEDVADAVGVRLVRAVVYLKLSVSCLHAHRGQLLWKR
jgi:hypothetical protein